MSRVDTIAPATHVPVSNRVTAIQSPVIPIVGELTQANPGTISLGQGVVSYPPPQEAINKIQDFEAKRENHKYKLVQGIPELLSAIQSKLSQENQIQIEAKAQVVVTAGSNMGFNNAILAIADPGDEIILPTPYYFNHEMAIELASCTAITVPTNKEHQLDINLLKTAITPKTKAIVTVSPNNPSGAIYSKASLIAVNELCRERGIYHISDEAYEYFTYEGCQHFSPGSIPGASGHTISLFSLSKAYGFASWRIGYMVIPPHLLPATKKIQDTILICPPVISQYAAWGAMEAGNAFWAPKIQALSESRKMVLNELKSLDEYATIAPALGAFYFLVKLRQKADPMDVIKYLIEEHKVAAIPGTAFGLTDACYLRIAYAALPIEPLKEGIGRFESGIRAFSKRSASI